MKDFLRTYFNFKNALVIIILFLTCSNFITLFKVLGAVTSGPLIRTVEPGYEFADFKPLLAGVEYAGFLTDKDMTPENNDGQFLGAQYMLAPVVLELGNPGREWTILDYSGFIFTFEKIRHIGAGIVRVNEHEKILAKKP